MSRAAAAVAEAVSAVIAARIIAALGTRREVADVIASVAVADLQEDGWYITALPAHTPPRQPRKAAHEQS